MLTHVKDSKPKLLEDSTTVRWRQGLNYFISKSFGHIFTIVNYEVLLHSVKEKTNSTEPSGTGIMLQLVEGLLTCR